MNKAFQAFWLVLGLVCFAQEVSAQQSTSPLNFQIPKTSQAPKIDASLTDEEWGQAAKITDFVQVNPGDRSRPSDQTTVYLMYDSENLYVAFYCKSTKPNSIRANLTRRDDIFQDDYVFLTLDTFNDQQQAYQFYFNPLGIQADAVISENSGTDLGFDTLLTSRGRLTGDGYIVEVAIPFRSLRYKEGTWGLHLGRKYQENNREDSWVPLIKGTNSYLAQEGHIEGLDGISKKNLFEIIPTASFLEEGSRISPNQFLNRPVETRTGVSFKYLITSNLTLDIASKPDYNLFNSSSLFQPSSVANVIIDIGDNRQRAFLNNNLSVISQKTFPNLNNTNLTTIAQLPILKGNLISFNQTSGLQSISPSPDININTISTLLNFENRPFFVEGADIFRTPLNIIDTSQISSPIFTAKLTGKIGKYSIGAFTALDRETSEAFFYPNNEASKRTDRPLFTALRLKRDFLTGSNVGFTLTDREFAGSFNRVGSFDAKLLLGKNYIARLQFVETLTKDLDGKFFSGHSSLVDFSYSSKRLGYGVNYQDTTNGYSSSLGFFQPSGRTITGRFNTALLLPENSDAKLRSLILNSGASASFDSNGDIRNQNYFLGTILNLKNNTSTGISANYFRSNFGSISFDSKDVALSSTTTFSKIFSATSGVSFQDSVSFLGNTRFLTYGSNVNVKPNQKLNLGFGVTRLQISSKRNGIITNTFYTGRISQQFTRNIGVAFTSNYNSISRDSNNNFSFTYSPNASTFILIGYNELLSFRGMGVSQTDRQFLAKLSYLLRF